MLDSILNLVKETVTNSVNNTAEVPEDKKAQVVETATHAVTSGLKDNFTLGNLSNLMDIFKSGASLDNNPVTNNIVNSVTNELIKKAGLQQSTSNLISTTIVPLVMNTISEKIKGGINLESIIKSFSDSDKHEGGLLDKIKGLFGK